MHLHVFSRSLIGSVGGVLLALMFVMAFQPHLAESSNILGVFTSHSQSHLIVHMSIMKALAEQGHNVTVVSSFKPKVTHANIHSIVVPLSPEELEHLESSISDMSKQTNSVFTTVFRMLGQLRMMIDKQYDVINDRRVRALYENPSDSKFDLLFVGWFINTYQLGLAAKLKCPVIVSWTSLPVEMVNELVGNPREESYVSPQSVAGERISFGQRLKNFFVAQFNRFLNMIIEYHMETFFNRLFADDNDVPSYATVKKNVSMVFCNSHAHSEGPIRPNVPAIIEIGGIQVKEQPDPLPKDITDFLADATHGSIFLSLGSNLKSTYLNPDIVANIFKVLSSLEQKVIWKWEDRNNTPGKSPNILFKKWLPQDDLLAHPSLRLFITHAGKGGVAEAQYHGVPMLAMPVFADQPDNAHKLVAAGYGLRLDLLTLKPDELHAAIGELLENSSYKRNIKAFSALYRDRPFNAKQTVVFWTEYVLRHHGAPQLQSPLVHMNFVQSNNLDVYALLALVLFTICLFTKLVIKFLYKKLTRKSEKAEENAKKKKKA